MKTAVRVAPRVCCRGKSSHVQNGKVTAQSHTARQDHPIAKANSQGASKAFWSPRKDASRCFLVNKQFKD